MVLNKKKEIHTFFEKSSFYIKKFEQFTLYRQKALNKNLALLTYLNYFFNLKINSKI